MDTREVWAEKMKARRQLRVAEREQRRVRRALMDDMVLAASSRVRSMDTERVGSRGLTERMSDALQRAGMNTAHLADACGRLYGTVRHHVKGRAMPRSDDVAAYAVALGVRAEWLAFGTGAMYDHRDGTGVVPAAGTETTGGAIPQGD